MRKTLEKEVLTFREACDFLRVGKAVLYSLARGGILGKKVGREWRFLKDDLISWLASGEETAAPSDAQRHERQARAQS